jgi:TPR repeat protein
LEAFNSLGGASLEGLGGTTSPAEAPRFFEKAAEGGDARGAIIAGVAYRDGFGVEMDLAEAPRRFREGPEMGSPQGAFEVGWAYRDD